MDNQNVSLIIGDNKFNYRVAVLIENNGRVLLENSGDFWNMVGGRVHIGESSLETAKRELKEELGIEIFDLKLINVSENFFEWMGKHQNEMLFVYKVDLDNNYEITQKDNFKCLDSDEIFKWHKIDDIDSLVCKPAIIKELAKRDNNQITHTIEK